MFFKLCNPLTGVVSGGVGDIHDTYLFGREPEGQSACILFDKHSECAFIAADRTSVDDIGTFFNVIAINVFHIKPFGERKINLHSKQGVFFTKNIFKLEIQLRAVKCSLAVGFFIINPDFVKILFHNRLGAFPRLGVIDILTFARRIPFRKSIGNIVRYPQILHHTTGNVDCAFKLIGDLFGSADDMSVRQGKLTHTD